MKEMQDFQTMGTEEIKELINRRRRQILLHSYIYYRLNDTIISNAKFDLWALELIQLQKTFPDISKDVALYDVFCDFTNVGDAAFLPLDGDDHLDIIARQLLNNHHMMLSKEENEQYC